MASPPPADLLIQNDAFLIRPLVRGDAHPKLESWIEDENAAAMLNTPRRSWTLDQQAEFFGRHEGQSERLILGIFPTDAREPIGLFIVKVRPRQGVFLISHLIGDKEWRGKDATFGASEAVYDYFFNRLGYAKAKVNVRPENKPMLWLLYTYMWRKEAHLVGHLRLAGTGERSDLLVFGMLADEWRNRPERMRFVPGGGNA
ncbi:MAG: GNAT family N-acetyltransferase [Parvibaculaceae bacterium]